MQKSKIKTEKVHLIPVWRKNSDLSVSPGYIVRCSVKNISKNLKANEISDNDGFIGIDMEHVMLSCVFDNLQMPSKIDGYTICVDCFMGNSCEALGEPYLARNPSDVDPLDREARDHALVLGILWPCTISDVDEAYKKLCMKWHPDKACSEPEVKDFSLKMAQISISANWLRRRL